MSYTHAIPWESLLARHQKQIGDETCHLLLRQYKSWIAGQAPAIADDRIKEIPIHECHEPCIDIRKMNYSRIRVMEGDELLQAHQYPEDIDPRSENHACMRTGVFEALKRVIDELDLLAPSFGYEPGELEIRLFEGLRDLKTQKELFDSKMAALHEKCPALTEEELYRETAQWVSPYINNVPVHSTGAAIDIHLWSSKKGAFCDMGRFNVGGTTAPMFSDDATIRSEQRLHRLLLLIAATRAGLTNYLHEFWHFSYGDRYAAYWRQHDGDARSARYGAVE